MSLESGPFLTMVTLGVAGLSAFPWPTLVGSILPLAFGMLIGNLDKDMREFLGRAVPVMIPFFAFALGAGLDLHKVWLAGLIDGRECGPIRLPEEIGRRCQVGWTVSGVIGRVGRHWRLLEAWNVYPH